MFGMRFGLLVLVYNVVLGISGMATEIFP